MGGKKRVENKLFIEIYVREQTVILILRRNSVIQKGDTIVREKHKSVVITLVERYSKAIITLKTNGRKASDIEASINQQSSQVPNHLFKSITFDCGKEFSNWKSISNAHDIDIFFAHPGCPGQRGLNEHSNGLLRRNGLPKQMDFTNISQNYLLTIADKRNRIPRKSLNYQTPYQVFLNYMKNLTKFDSLGN